MLWVFKLQNMGRFPADVNMWRHLKAVYRKKACELCEHKTLSETNNKL